MAGETQHSSFKNYTRKIWTYTSRSTGEIPIHAGTLIVLNRLK